MTTVEDRFIRENTHNKIDKIVPVCLSPNGSNVNEALVK